MKDGFIATLGISFLDRSQGGGGAQKRGERKGEESVTREVENSDTTDADTSRASGGSSSRGSRYRDENIVNLAKVGKGRFGRLSRPRRAFSSLV